MQHPDYLGFTEEEAREQAEKDGFKRVRIAARDGNHFVLTADYHTDRVNLAVTNGRVTESRIG